MLSSSFFDTPAPWRHHGLGLIQREVNETLRVHVWDIRLRRIWGLRAVHDHRFTMTSTVLAGIVVDAQWFVYSDPIPANDAVEVDAWEIVHAKAQSGDDGRCIGRRWCYRDEPRMHQAGATYSVDESHFHDTSSAFAITIVSRHNFREAPARILVPVGERAVSGIVGQAHAGDARDDGLIEDVLQRARRELRL